MAAKDVDTKSFQDGGRGGTNDKTPTGTAIAPSGPVVQYRRYLPPTPLQRERERGDYTFFGLCAAWTNRKEVKKILPTVLRERQKRPGIPYAKWAGGYVEVSTTDGLQGNCVEESRSMTCCCQSKSAPPICWVYRANSMSSQEAVPWFGSVL